MLWFVPYTMKYVDLHTHTQYSDGTTTPSQNVRDAAFLGTEVVAIADHDTTRGYAEARNESRRWGIKTISAVEISTSFYHILGYDFDVEHKGLQELLAYSRHVQEDTVRKRTDLLREAGIPMSLDTVKTHFPDSRLGKGNILMTFYLDDICRQHIRGMTRQDVHKKYLGRNGVAGKVDYMQAVRSKEAIDAIHAAGGLAVVAHPFRQVSEPEELDGLIQRGIDGLEVQPNFGDKNIPFKAWAEEKGLFITYGSDYHGPGYAQRPLLSRGENRIEKFWTTMENSPPQDDRVLDIL